MKYHAVASLSGGRQKTLPNKTEEQMLAEVVLPFVSTGVVSAKWGDKTQSYQVLELKIYKTEESWDKKAGSFSEKIEGRKNIYSQFRKKADLLLSSEKHRVFIITPIQGSKYGDQEQQRILREYNDRFKTLEKVIQTYGGIAIRIDREQELEDLVTRIKREIRGCSFIIADLTDERQSCYFEAGYAEAARKPIIYIASQNSVMSPGNKTKIHFDIHHNVQFFTNIEELKEKISQVIEKNKDKLFPKKESEDDPAEVVIV